MVKKYIFLFFALGLFLGSNGQVSPNSFSQNGQDEMQTIQVEKGQTLLDVMPAEWMLKTQTDINPGIDPEGDFMLRFNVFERWNESFCG